MNSNDSTILRIKRLITSYHCAIKYIVEVFGKM